MNVFELFSLKGRVALVTGGAGMYGLNISQALAEAGATVVMASRNLEHCAREAERLKETGLACEAAQLDLASEESVRACVSALMERHGRIDVLVNNAVDRRGMAGLEDATKEGWEQAQRVNSTGLMLVTREAVAHMRERGSGSIINISSIQGVVGPHFPVYEGTGMSSPLNYTYDKWGMVGFTKWVANQYGRFGIRSNCISPGGYGPGVEAGIGENAFTKRYRQLTPLGRFANEDDIKGAVVYFASDASAYVTGQNLPVDGGWTSW